MTSIVLVEFRPGLLEIRRELLESLGHPVISIQGLSAEQTIPPPKPYCCSACVSDLWGPTLGVALGNKSYGLVPISARSVEQALLR